MNRKRLAITAAVIGAIAYPAWTGSWWAWESLRKDSGLPSRKTGARLLLHRHHHTWGRVIPNYTGAIAPHEAGFMWY
jgi:hypothetical protein